MAGIGFVAGHILAVENGVDLHTFHFIHSAENRGNTGGDAAIVLNTLGALADGNTGGDRGWIGDVPEFRYNLSKVNSLGWKAAYTSNGAVRLAIQKALGK